MINQVRDQRFVANPIHPIRKQARARVARADECPTSPSVLAEPAIKRNSNLPEDDLEVDSIRADPIGGPEISRSQRVARVPSSIIHQLPRLIKSKGEIQSPDKVSVSRSLPRLVLRWQLEPRNIHRQNPTQQHRLKLK